MKQFIEFIPLIVFFAVYKFYDIYTATGALVVVTGLQLLYSWLRYRRVEKMQLFTFVLVGFFGGLTVFFHDDAFIKWKVTVINVLFALALLIGRYGFGKNLIKQMLAKELQAPDRVWDNVNLGWVGFFTVCGLLNFYVAFNMPQEMWVNFKVFGLLLVLSLLMLVSMIPLFIGLIWTGPLFVVSMGILYRTIFGVRPLGN